MSSFTTEMWPFMAAIYNGLDARFAAAFLCDPRPTLESILWIVAKSGFTREVAPLMNLSKATRECKNLQREMREVKTATVIDQLGRKRGGQTQLLYYCEHGMTSSVVRMFEMRSIDMEAKGGVNEWTCLMKAVDNGHLAICRLLIDKGAQEEARARGSGRGSLRLPISTSVS
jgi:hypothetical protein